MTDTTKAFLLFVLGVALFWGAAIFCAIQDAWFSASICFCVSFFVRTLAVEDGPDGDGSRSKFSLTEIYIKRKGFKGFEGKEDE